ITRHITAIPHRLGARKPFQIGPRAHGPFSRSPVVPSSRFQVSSFSLSPAPCLQPFLHPLASRLGAQRLFRNASEWRAAPLLLQSDRRPPLSRSPAIRSNHVAELTTQANGFSTATPV